MTQMVKLSRTDPAVEGSIRQLIDMGTYKQAATPDFGMGEVNQCLKSQKGNTQDKSPSILEKKRRESKKNEIKDSMEGKKARG